MNTTVYATLALDDIYATLSATATQDSYGVQGSPTWLTLEDMRVEALAILGVDVNLSALPDTLIAKVFELADEWLDESNWESLE